MATTIALSSLVLVSHAQEFDEFIIGNSGDGVYCPNSVVQKNLFVTGWNYVNGDTFTATVDWGDGTTESVQQPVYPGMAANGSDYFAAYFQDHAYAGFGSYTITYEVTDEYGNTMNSTEEISIQQNCFDIAIGIFIMGEGCESPGEDLEFHFTAEGVDYTATADIYSGGMGQAYFEFEDLPYDMPLPMDITVDGESLAAMNLSLTDDGITTLDELNSWSMFYTKMMVECEEAASGIKETTSEISIYPVPADDQITIQSLSAPIIHVTAIDLAGRTIPLTINGNVVATGTLPAGCYELSVQTEKELIHRTIMIRH